MEVLVTPSSPAHVSAPSTPNRFGEYYFSAPTSPSRLSQFYRDFDDLLAADNGSGGEGGAASEVAVQSNGDDFAFDVSEDFSTASSTAEELFDGGVIKPLIKPPPRLQLPGAARFSEHVKSPPRGNSGVKTPSPAAKNTARADAGNHRGRERGINLSKSSSRRAARSLSPLRDAQYQWEEKTEQSHNTKNSSSITTICSALSMSGKGYKKWRLKDFFLFRSASEGRAADKDPFKKYTAAIRHSSSRAIDSPGSGSGSGSRRRGPISAHEMHYTMNRAVSEDLKKKTFLPYKQGILGRLAFNPAVHALANGFGFSRK